MLDLKDAIRQRRLSEQNSSPEAQSSHLALSAQAGAETGLVPDARTPHPPGTLRHTQGSLWRAHARRTRHRARLSPSGCTAHVACAPASPQVQVAAPGTRA